MRIVLNDLEAARVGVCFELLLDLFGLAPIAGAGACLMTHTVQIEKAPPCVAPFPEAHFLNPPFLLDFNPAHHLLGVKEQFAAGSGAEMRKSAGNPRIPNAPGRAA